MSDRSGQNDTDNSFAGISFEGVNAVPPQSGENGDTINLADVADVSEQDDVSNAATETMPPLMTVQVMVVAVVACTSISMRPSSIRTCRR